MIKGPTIWSGRRMRKYIEHMPRETHRSDQGPACESWLCDAGTRNSHRPSNVS